MTRIRIGQIIRIGAVDYRVAERQRGRPGEERVMYVLERQRSDGTWYRSEARCRSSLLRYLR